MHSRRVVLCLVLCLAGCSERGAKTIVSGEVMLDGNPLPGAEVQFLTVQAGAPVAVFGAVTDAQGRYETTSAEPGSYKVAIRCIAPVGGEDAAMLQLQGGIPSPLPARYADPHRTELAAELEKGRQTKSFALRSKP